MLVHIVTPLVTMELVSHSSSEAHQKSGEIRGQRGNHNASDHRAWTHRQRPLHLVMERVRKGDLGSSLVMYTQAGTPAVPTGSLLMLHPQGGRGFHYIDNHVLGRVFPSPPFPKHNSSNP